MVTNSPSAAKLPTGSDNLTGLDRFFDITKRRSTVGREVRGGLVTFFAMAYIIALNPLIIGTAPDKNFNLISGAPMFLDEAHTQVDPVAIGVSIGMVAAATALIDRHCTAVVCASDMMALGAIRAARQRGLEVPRDVSVVGFDDSPLIAFTDPPLTTVRKPVPAMGQAAVRTLLEEIGGTPAPHSEFVFMPELVVRGSTASAPHLLRTP